MADNRELHGLMARFADPDALVRAAAAARSHGYSRLDAYSPHPLPELVEALDIKDRRVPVIALLCAVLSGSFIFLLQVYAALDYPFYVSGKPVLAWPAFVIPTFSMTVLGAALGALFGMLACGLLPWYYHPVFNSPGFDRVSDDGYFLCLEAADALFDRQKTREFLQGLNAVDIHEVAP